MGLLGQAASGRAVPGTLSGNLKGEQEDGQQRREGFGKRKHRGRTAGGASGLARSGHCELRTSREPRHLASVSMGHG